MKAIFPSGCSIALALAAVVRADGTGLEVGLDVTIDSTFGLSPAGVKNSAVQGFGLLHVNQTSGAAAGETPTWVGHVSVMGLAGKGPTEKFLGDFNAVSNAEADRGLRLYTAWAEWNHRAVSARVGSLLADEEFATTDSGGALLNAGFGWPSFISANTRNTGPAFFIPALGARLRFEAHPQLTLQAGLYDGDSWDSEDGDSHVNQHGTRFSLSRDQGAFSMAEAQWRSPRGHWGVKLGAWHHSGEFADTYADHAGEAFVHTGQAPRVHSGNQGTYVSVTHQREQPLGWSGRWDAHARYGWAQTDRNTVADAVDLGWVWSGLWPGREDDALAVGFLHTQLSAPYTRTLVLQDPSTERLDFEQVWEMGYHWQITPKLSLHPDFQVIRQPGGDPSRPTAKVLILRFSAQF